MFSLLSLEISTSLSALSIGFTSHHDLSCKSDNVKSSHAVHSEDTLELIQRVWSLFGQGLHRYPYPRTVDRGIQTAILFHGNFQRTLNIRLRGYLQEYI